jgi:hypothetical protein
VNFPAPVYLNEIKILPGQYNGEFNRPNSYKLIDADDNSILFSANITSYQWHTFDLISLDKLNTPRSSYKFIFYGENDPVSILELDLYGVIAK